MSAPGLRENGLVGLKSLLRNGLGWRNQRQSVRSNRC